MGPFNRNLLKRLGEPVFPYAGDTYNTLSSTVQNVALAAIAYYFVQTFLESKVMTIDMATRFLVAFVIVVVVWHRYITHNHFAAWLPRFRDTLIIVGFAVIQYLVIFTAPKYITYFSWSLFLTSAWGIFAYKNTERSFNEKEVKIFFEAHFEDKRLAHATLDFCHKFSRICIRQIWWVAAIYLVSAVLVTLNIAWLHWKLAWLPIQIETILFLGSTTIVGFILFNFDLGYYLKNDAALQAFLDEKEIGSPAKG